ATTVYVTHDQTEAMTMADRIAVILHGELQQIGTPSEIYRSPMTVGVAEFVGSPKINILPCRTSGNVIECLGQTLRSEAPSQGMKDGSIGLRPEHVVLTGRTGGNLPCRIVSLEYLGSEVLLAVETADGTQIGLRMDVEAFEHLPDREALAVELPARHALLFDASGKRTEWRAAA
ncbi:TOBE domain-containing protein, partial [Vineibacter terrae]|uniref:TOBE domain-containing protein n=1 Tax=Vineibacter terrae TaxID=2586908 RepID=UPI002E381FB2